METKTEDTLPLAGIQKIKRANPEINHQKKINTGSKNSCKLAAGLLHEGGCVAGWWVGRVMTTGPIILKHIIKLYIEVS